jgi:hypothetical protein
VPKEAVSGAVEKTDAEVERGDLWEEAMSVRGESDRGENEEDREEREEVFGRLSRKADDHSMRPLILHTLSRASAL